jgi:hypothetical protein
MDMWMHTGPVMVEFALLVQVPTSSAGRAAVWACAPRMAAPESSSAAIRDNMVGVVWCGVVWVRERVWMVGGVRKRAWVREGRRLV